MCYSTQPVVDPDTDFSKLSDYQLKKINPHYKIGVLNPAYKAWLQKQKWGSEQLKPQVFPLGKMPFMRLTDEGLDFQVGVYGLLPDKPFVKEMAYARKWSTYNARSEEIFERKTNMDAIRYRRCVLITLSFWEWSEEQYEPDGKKHNYHISMKDGSPFFIAGLWENHPQFGFSCSIVTTDPIKQVWDEAHHKRSPMILPPEKVEAWLDPAIVEPKQIQTMFEIWHGGKLKIERVK